MSDEVLRGGTRAMRMDCDGPVGWWERGSGFFWMNGFCRFDSALLCRRRARRSYLLPFARLLLMKVALLLAGVGSGAKNTILGPEGGLLSIL